MAKLSSSISLIDNMSKVLNRITGNTDKMKKSIDNTQKQMNQETNFAKNLSKEEQILENVGAKYAHQARLVQRLREEYEKSINTKGRYHDATQKIEGRLLSAQEKEMKLADSVNEAGKALERQHNEMNKNIQSSGGLINKIKGLVGAYLSFRAVKGLLKSTIGGAGELTRQVGIMQAAFGDTEVGKNYFNQLRLYAIETRNSISDLTDVTRNFMQITKNTKHLKGFTDAANKLSLRTGNIGSAENLMQEAMRGNFTRLQRVLHLTDAQIAPLKKAISKGSLEGIIKGFDDALNTAGLTDAVVDAYQNSPIEKMEKAVEKFKTGMAMAGEEALSRLEPVLDRLNSWLESSKADAFFGAISFGITMVVEAVTWLTNIIISNWDLILPILLAVATVFIPQLIMQLWSMASVLMFNLGLWVAANMPILTVIGTIAIFIGMLMQSGITAEQVIGSVAGFFTALGAVVYNVVASMWNIIASLAEFFVNVWKYPGYAFKKLWHDLKNIVLDFVIAGGEGLNKFANGAIQVAEGIANAFIRAFNAVKRTINGLSFDVPDWVPKIGGKHFGLNLKEKSEISLGNVDVISGLKSIKSNMKAPTMPSGAWEAPRMNLKDVTNAAKKGYEFGSSIPDKFSTGLNGIKDSIADFAGQEDAWNNLQNNGLNNGLGGLGKQGKDLNKTGKDLKKSVDKSNEDLKYLRDLAEKEVINRFTTAEIKIEQNNQNNINNEMDLDGVINYLAEGVDESMQIAAEGVY